MRRTFIVLLLLLITTLIPISYSKITRYGETLCNDLQYTCVTITRGQTWEKLWPDPEQRDIVKRINRMNTPLHAGMKIAVPKTLGQANLNVMDYSPFVTKINPATNQKLIIVDPSVLAWGAYNENGDLVFWGPMSGGKSYCPDVGSRCFTPTGNYEIYEKRGAGCFSSKFPVGKGGAPMPFCMFFHGGYALHGSNDVPGYHDSHGCVRIFTQDARWLNQDFINMPNQGGTQVLIKRY